MRTVEGYEALSIQEHFETVRFLYAHIKNEAQRSGRPEEWDATLYRIAAIYRLIEIQTGRQDHDGSLLISEIRDHMKDERPIKHRSFQELEAVLDRIEAQGGYGVHGGPSGDQAEVGLKSKGEEIDIIEGDDYFKLLEHMKWRTREWLVEIHEALDEAGVDRSLKVEDRVRKIVAQAKDWRDAANSEKIHNTRLKRAASDAADMLRGFLSGEIYVDIDKLEIENQIEALEKAQKPVPSS